MIFIIIGKTFHDILDVFDSNYRIILDKMHEK